MGAPKSGAAWAARILGGGQTTDMGAVLSAKVVNEGSRKASPAARNAAARRKAKRKAAKRARRRNR